jgi:perosamine synthetase
MGYNYRLPDILAAIGNIQYAKLPIFTTARQKNAEFLSQLLSNIPGIILPKINPGNSHVFHQFTIRVTEDFPICREDLIAKLAVDGIGTKIYYPTPIHLYSHFARF